MPVHRMHAWHLPAYAAVQFCFKSSALRSCLSAANKAAERQETTQDKVGIRFITFISGGK